MRSFSFFLAVTISLALSACARKPSYSEMNINASQQPASPQPAAGDTAQAPQPGGETPTTPAAPGAQNANAQPPNAEARKVVLPSFIDQKTNGVKDLPNYPNAYVTNTMYGPQGEYNTMRITLQTADPIEKIMDYYEKAARTNGWKVIGKRSDSESGEMNFEKGEKDIGGIRAQRNVQTNLVNISVARAEKM